MLRVTPLGGLGEIGMNCLALEQRGEVLVVDCGVTFDHRGLGVDVVHPDFSALEPFAGRIAGLFLTHGHEDHIGAVPYFLRRFDVPVYGPRYALALLRERAEEHEILEHARFIETTPRSRYNVGSFGVEPIRVTHSIADATALAIETDAGRVVHTGDFKFDEDPPDGEAFDTARLTELGDRGVSLLFSDSTSIDAPGEAGSEQRVGGALEAMVADAPGAVFVGLFASNVHRLRMLGAIAARLGRKIVLLGRSVNVHARVARATGYLDWSSDLVWPAERARELERRKVLGLVTGTQAEANAALARLARGEYPAIDLRQGDRVILSSRVIPGNEPQAFAVMADLLRRGCELHTWYSDRAVHVSGHAYRGEQTRMIELVRPRAFVPVHGTLHHLTRHAALARELGVRDAHVLENGDVLELDEHGSRRAGKAPAGRVHVFGGRVIPPDVLRDRMALAQDGVVVAVVPVDEKMRRAGAMWIGTRGVLDAKSADEVVPLARGEALAAMANLDRVDAALVAEAVRLAVRRAFARVLGFKPVVLVHIQQAEAP